MININNLTKIKNKETDIFFKSFLERYYFSQFRKNLDNYPYSIELMVQGNCPSKCKYCYLQNHLEDLYPSEIDKEELILPHLQFILNWYKKEHFVCPLELYSGRQFSKNGIGWKVLEIIYNNFKDSYYKPSVIIIPDDMQFLLNKDLENDMNQWIKKFESINIPINISASVDGLKCDNCRYGSKKEEFYDTIFNFLKLHIYNLHPMIAAVNIENWIDNFLWFYQKDPTLIKNAMLLEVRDDNWTDDKIFEYIKFCNFIINFYQKIDNNKQSILEYLLHTNGNSHQAPQLEFEGNQEIARERISCAIQTCFHIRLGDLAIVPCHRLAYEQFIGGYFLYNDYEITDIKAYNPSFYINTHSCSLNTLPKCHNCEYNKFCLGGCLGSNYESTGDAFYPPDSICKLMQLQTDFKLLKLLSIDNNLEQTQILLPDIIPIITPIINNLYKKLLNDDYYITKIQEIVNNG